MIFYWYLIPAPEQCLTVGSNWPFCCLHFSENIGKFYAIHVSSFNLMCLRTFFANSEASRIARFFASKTAVVEFVLTNIKCGCHNYFWLDEEFGRKQPLEQNLRWTHYAILFSSLKGQVQLLGTFSPYEDPWSTYYLIWHTGLSRPKYTLLHLNTMLRGFPDLPSCNPFHSSNTAQIWNENKK